MRAAETPVSILTGRGEGVEREREAAKMGGPNERPTRVVTLG